MKSSKIDRIISVVVIGTCLIKAVLYGGSKPPASTNTPPGDVSCPTNTVGGDVLGAPQPSTNENAFICGCGVPGGHALPLRTVATPELTANNQQLTTNVPWHVRGAFCDWVHITFPDGFAFPHGTNLLTGVTLMAYGSLVLGSSPSRTKECSNLLCTTTTSDYDYSLPHPVSLEPDASSFVHGLTPSNSYLFAWQNVCVDRDPTNRVNAAIELFRNGDMAMMVASLSTPTPPTYTYVPAVPPPGYVGEGQDTNWLAAAFSPTDYAAITNKGYARWLDEDYVGYNEENGHYKATVTVHSMPPNDEPCYLECGPYRVVVKEPGDYSFPLEVFNEYTVRTYPTAMPLSISYDEGYYPDEDDYGLLMPPPNQSGPLLLGAPSPTVLTACMIPTLHLLPSVIPLERAANACIRLWCNMRHVAWRFESLVSIGFMVTFDSRNIARITDAVTTYGAEGVIYDDGHPEVCANISLIPSSYPWPWPHEPDPTNGCDTGGSDTNNTSNGQTP